MPPMPPCRRIPPCAARPCRSHLVGLGRGPKAPEEAAKRKPRYGSIYSSRVLDRELLHGKRGIASARRALFIILAGGSVSAARLHPLDCTRSGEDTFCTASVIPADANA